MKSHILSILISIMMVATILPAYTVTSFADDEAIGEDFISYDEFDPDSYVEGYAIVGESGVAPVTDLKVSNITYNSATLKWSNPGNIDGYDLYKEVIVAVAEDEWEIDYIVADTINDPNICTYQLHNLLSCEYYGYYVVPFKLMNGVKTSADMYECENVYFQTLWCNKGSFYTSNKKLAKSLTKVFKAYKENAKFKGSGECYGYAEWGSKKIAKTRKKVNINKKMTLQNVNKYIVGLKSGAHVRFYSPNLSHSALIIKATKNRIYWIDNNWGYNNRVHYHAGDVAAFYRQYCGYTKIQWIMKTKAYR